eukprot:11545032-Alexandrium_andersonii.AAC.1
MSASLVGSEMCIRDRICQQAIDDGHVRDRQPCSGLLVLDRILQPPQVLEQAHEPIGEIPCKEVDGHLRRVQAG